MSGVELAAAAVSSVGTFGATELYTNIRSKVDSSQNLDEQYDLLVEEMQKLLAFKDDKEREVYRNHHKNTTSAYKLWTNMVSKAEGEFHKLTDKYHHKKRLSTWWGIQGRSRLSKEIAKKRSHIFQLRIDGQDSRDFLVDKQLGRVLKDQLHVPQVSGYPTLQNALENILAYLKNNKIRVIGVHGAKGVGKTTIMRNLNNHEEVAKLFDIVIFVKVADKAHTLQEKIAKRLMLDIEAIKNQRVEIARKILKELKSKKYLLILDDVEEALNLEELGIPSDKNGSKVVIATQLPRVYKLSRVERVVQVMKLSDEEAWKMFRDTVSASSSAIDSLDVRPIAELVCKRCSRLPLLIHIIANSFKLKESASSWWAGLEDLKPWPQLENQGLRELYSCLEFCYEELIDENKKKCFLYTSLYPADSQVYTDYLVECWAAQGLLGDINDTRRYQSARNNGIDILERLTNVSLLEKGEPMIYVWMNDCIRQLALHISSKDPDCSFYLQHTEESLNLSSSRSRPRWVSMIGAKSLNSLEKSLNSLENQDRSMILTLLLQKNPELAKIPKTLFKKMSTLLVLDLHSTGITQLPSSLSKLTALRGLFLNSCMLLTSLSSEIKSLQFLEVLDIRDTNVIFIPLHIGRLTNLRCLRIPFFTTDEQNEVQNVHVISKLHRLEELTIQVNSYEQWCKDAEIVLKQVASLENLTALKCCFPSAIILQEFLLRSKSWTSNKQQNSFRFFVGCKSLRRPQILESFKDKITKYLMYCNGEGKDDSAIGEILPKTHAFELISHKDIESLSNFVGVECMNHIRGLVIERCNEVSSIVAGGNISSDTGNGFQVENRVMLPNLEQLYLENMLKLKCAFRGPLHDGTLCKLQNLSLKNCPLLRKIFSNGAIQHFSELQKLKIEDCSTIEELLILGEDIERERDVLPKLEILELINLPNLKMICSSSSHTLAWSSLELLRIHECPELKTLPFDTSNAANLRSIEGHRDWWDGLEWTNIDNHNELRVRLQPIFFASSP